MNQHSRTYLCSFFTKLLVEGIPSLLFYTRLLVSAVVGEDGANAVVVHMQEICWADAGDVSFFYHMWSCDIGSAVKQNLLRMCVCIQYPHLIVHPI